MNYRKRYSFTKLKILEELISIKLINQECKICHYNYLIQKFVIIVTGENFAIINSNSVSYIFFMFDMTEKDVIELISDFEFDK